MLCPQFGDRKKMESVPAQPSQLFLKVPGRHPKTIEPAATQVRRYHVVHEDSGASPINRFTPPGITQRQQSRRRQHQQRPGRIHAVRPHSCSKRVAIRSASLRGSCRRTVVGVPVMSSTLTQASSISRRVDSTMRLSRAGVNRMRPT